MINNLLTIVIPCKNSVRGLKKTVEDLMDKTKISGTSIIIPDFGSLDGSFQYAAQSSSEFHKILRIESIKMEDGEDLSNLKDIVKTPYALVIVPGVSFKNKDIFIESINSISNEETPLAYLKKNKALDPIMGSLLKKRRKVKAVFIKKENITDISSIYNSDDPEIIIKNNSLSEGIKIEGFIG
jgi:hypothetical protein